MAEIVLFPFMSKGHMIPIIHLAHLLINRGLPITIFTTPSNSPFIRQSLKNNVSKATIIDLPFPKHVPNLPSGVESTDQLPSMSLFLPFINAVKLLRPHFEQALESLPRVSFIISDGFLGWTQISASRLGIPWILFYGMNFFAMTISRVVLRDQPHAGHDNDEPFSIQCFPWIKLTRNDLSPPFNDPEPSGPLWDFIVETGQHASHSSGMIVNSFYELEPVYVDYWKKVFDTRIWCVGPLCLSVPRAETLSNTKWLQWLNKKLAMQRPVLYVAFGTQAEVLNEQLQEIAIGLDRSEVDFLWVVRSKEAELGDGFEERVAERGLVVREWVEQVAVLEHESVRGFMSHCGWNSVLESIGASVPILAWPMMAEQHLNAKLVEELGIGLRIEARNGKGCNGLVSSDDVEKMVRELMGGEKGCEAGKKMQEVGQAGRRAMEESGTSWRSLDLLLEELKLA
ncbi:UDP-glycosyltransferase 90A1-like [Magnolia sinica]|uniref:UDP-glycosyltransferase 90A1-like n=1 Tax=Magnolia sinica TaxID=86752 RepID=UPI002659B895|nr:UDP-glycosyltransferase 90A1-like [Magnolia sinica]